MEFADKRKVNRVCKCWFMASYLGTYIYCSHAQMKKLITASSFKNIKEVLGLIARNIHHLTWHALITKNEKN